MALTTAFNSCAALCCASLISHIQLFATPCLCAACQAPLSLGFSRQEYWRLFFCLFVLPCPPPGGLPNPGIEPKSPALQANSLPSEPPEKPFQQLPFNKCCQGNALGECTQGEQEILSLYISCVYAKSLHLCLTLCDPIDCSPPGSSVHGIL